MVELNVRNLPALNSVYNCESFLVSPQRLFGLPRNYLWNYPAFGGRLKCLCVSHHSALQDVYLTLRLLPKIGYLKKDMDSARAAHIPFNAMQGKNYLIAIA